MKIFTIIAGVNGCGKSSLTGALKAERKDLGILIDVDRLSVQHGSAVLGGKAAIKTINSCIRQGISFTQETTLSGVKTLKTIQSAKAAGYAIRLYYIGLDTAQDSIKRIQNRVEKGGHNIPENDVMRRFESRFKDLFRILPHCDECIFFDNDNGFVKVAEYTNGELSLNNSSKKAWVLQLAALQGQR